MTRDPSRHPPGRLAERLVSHTATAGWRLLPEVGLERGVQPLCEGWAGQGRVRAGQQGTAGVEGVVRVGRVADRLDLHHVAAPGGEQRGHVREILLARAGDLSDRRPRGGRLRRYRQGGERLGDRPGRDQLGAHPGQIAHLTLTAPRHQHLHELVELGRPQDLRRDRPGQRGPLVRELRGTVTSGEFVGTDDGHHHHRRTPARDPASCRFLAAVVKNPVAASCSADGPVAALTPDSTPSSAAARPSRRSRPRPASGKSPPPHARRPRARPRRAVRPVRLPPLPRSWPWSFSFRSRLVTALTRGGGRV